VQVVPTSVSSLQYRVDRCMTRGRFQVHTGPIALVVEEFTVV
jgi:hypothetical protein